MSVLATQQHRFGMGMPVRAALPAAAVLPPPQRKRWKPPRPEGPPPPLEDGVVNSIATYLESCGGTQTLGRLTAQFSGVKKAQLEAAFWVYPREGISDDLVSLATMDCPQIVNFVPVPSGDEESKKKRRKDPNAPPPGPLDEQTLQMVVATIQAHGGMMTLGKLTTLFEGLKKMQVEQHFVIAPLVGNGEWSVSLHRLANIPRGPDLRGLGGIVQAQQQTGRKRKPRPPIDPDAPPPEPLSPQMVEQITELLQANGGTIQLGRLATVVEGVKKAQLEPHFYVIPAENLHGQCAVSLDPNAAQSLAQTGSLIRPAGFAFGGLESGQAKVKKPKKQRDPDAPPPPPLEMEKVLEVRNVLLQAGGAISLGKLTAHFEGLRKLQLEPHFLVLGDATSSGAFTVYLDAGVAAACQAGAVPHAG